MTTRLHHRTLTDHLRSWDAPRVADLLARRPDLAHPDRPADIAELAQRAQQYPSVVRAIEETTLPQNRLLQVVVCCRPNVPLAELAGALPEGVGLDDVAGVLAELEAAALVWHHGERAHCSGTLRQAMPTTLGPPLQLLVKDQTVDYLKAAIGQLRRSAEGGGFSALLPPRATGPDGRPPRKAELVEEIEALLSLPDLVAAVLRSGPEEALDLAAGMAEGHPAVHLDHSLYFSSYGSRYGSSYQDRSATSWLFERALLLPDRYSTGFQPREVGVSLRGGRPVADLALARPALLTGHVDPASADGQATARAMRTLERLGDLIDRWEASPVKALKTGGLGVNAVKQASAALDVDLVETGRLIELAHLAGLVEVTTTSRKEGRAWVSETFVGSSAAATAWAERPAAERWSQLVTAWLRAEHWPSASGGKSSDGRSAPVLTRQDAATAPSLRRVVLDALASLDVGQTTDHGALAASVYWARPHPWLAHGRAPEVAIGWVHDEAELLGVVESGALSGAGRMLLRGDRRGAVAALEAAAPEPVRSFTLQADLTTVVVGTLERDVLVELRLLADPETSGQASTWRFSDATLRRGLDAGRDAEEILAFLEAHAAKGVPKPLAYLVGDVARRHGNLQVGAAGSFVTSHDPAVLADACSHRRTRKLALRTLAPTVAVSPHPPGKVLEGLRDAGFLPTVDGEVLATIDLAPARAPSPPKGGSASASLPEPFRARGNRRDTAVPPVDPAAALEMAESVLTGPPRQSGTRSTSGTEVDLPLALAFPPDPGDELADLDDPGSLEALLEAAFEGNRVLAVAIGDEEELAEPILLTVTGWEPDRIVGTDLADGSSVSILVEHVGAVADLGPVDELLDISPFGRRRDGRGRSRTRGRGR